MKNNPVNHMNMYAGYESAVQIFETCPESSVFTPISLQNHGWS